MTAFSGVRIIDFTQGIAGPMATMNLADFGAEVIKVEPPGGDRMKDHPGYICWNRNKQRLVLDVHRFDGLHAARELLATADAAVFDCHPGELERIGLDAVTLRAANPALLHVWLPPYSPTGRWSQLPPDDALLASIGAVAFLQGTYKDQPAYLVTPQATYGHAMVAAAAIAAGLYERQLTGHGQELVVSGLHGISGIESGGHISTGQVFRLGGTGSRGGVPNYRLYQCADGLWFFLGTLTPQFFLKALEAAEMLHLMALEGVDGEFANLLRPPTNQAVIQALDARFAEKPRAEWLRILQANDVPVGPVGNADEWFHGETVAANEMRIEMQHPKLGRVEMPGLPVRLSVTPASIRHLLKDVGPTLEHRLLPRPKAPAERTVKGPLAGVRVLDIGAFIAGTFAPCVLANFGAEVIKIEPPDGDPFRTYGLGFLGFNRGKRGLALNLKDPDGRQAFYDLVRVSDVVLDNYRLGVRERLGIDYATLKAINPRIISCSVTGYGPAGPLSKDPGFDPLVQARSGLMAAQGGDDEPVFYQVAINDTATAIMAAFGMIAALHARERTGEGQEVLTCLANQSILCQSGELTWYEGRPPVPKGGLDFIGPGALRRFYECADGWLCLASSAPEHYGQLSVALGHPEWAGRMTAENALKEPAHGPLADLIAEALKALPRNEAIDRLLTRGVPAAPALRIDELFGDPWIRANHHLDQYEYPLFGTITGVRTFADWSRTQGGFERPAPMIGQHSREVLRNCGFEDGRIEALVAAGTVIQATG
jgi:crotonobetainyl-CoA:carnitine CoA-transferase CaiB-like acyl-CoA transferase